MQIKKSSNTKKSTSLFLKDNLPVQILILLGIIGLSILAGSWFLDKAYIVYYLQKGKNLFIEQAVEIKNSETYLQKENGLSTLILDIPFNSLEKIKAKRVEAIESGILLSTDEDMVNAKAALDNQTPVKIDLRLKGDWVDHIEGSKWSYRIHVKGDNQIYGMTSFSIQAPETRQFLYEWAYHENLMMENILTTRYGFLNVVENGVFKGIYAIEESFTTELMEAQGARAGIILRFDEDALWINRANFIEDSDETYTAASQQGLFMITGMEQAQVQIFQSNSVTSNPVLYEEAKTAIALLTGFQNGTLQANDVFDVQKFGRFLAISDLWASNHATFWHNLRFYYNPITSLLEPVAYDGDTARYPSDSLAKIFADESYFKNPDIRRAYAKELERITDPDYFETLKTALSQEFDLYRSALIEEYGEELIPLPWDFLAARQTVMFNQINPPFPVQGRYTLVTDHGKPQLQVRLNNLMILPVKILGIEISTNTLNTPIGLKEINIHGDILTDTASPEINYIGGYNAPASPEAILSVNLSDETAAAIAAADELQITAMVQISGLTAVYRIPAIQDDVQQGILDRPASLFATAEEMWAQHAFIQKQDEQTLIIEKGDWQVVGDLVIPPQYSLVILPGTTLRFEENAILLTGNKILAMGTETQPIRLTAQDNNWAGIVVLSAADKSIINYTSIEQTASINRDGWILTGGVTFYESPVRIFNTTFSDHIGEDALNIIHSPYEMVYVKIQNSASDALDTDFSDGLILDCSFYQIGGDAIDVSGSTVMVKDSFMAFITDKAISAGEKSTVTIRNLDVDNANIGVASKDLSSVVIDQINLHDIHYAAFTAYIKKPVYGPSSIYAKNVYYTNVTELALVQMGNKVTLDEVVMETKYLDVKTLYDLGILGN
jgi:hypothetical protein